MPWSVQKRGARWCVVKAGESEPVPGGCHASQAKARAHQRALYASESGAALWWFVSKEYADRIRMVPVDPDGVYAAEEEGSDMAYETGTSGNASFSVSTISSLTEEGFEPILNAGGQTIGFLSNVQFSVAEGEEKPWSGILAVVGSPTSDKRFLIPGEIGERDLPIPLQVQLVTAEGHGGAHTAGRIHSIEQIPLSEFDAKDAFNLDGVHEDAIIVFGTGMLDGSEAAVEAERLIKNGAGISVDLPPDRLALIDPDTFEEVDEASVEMADVLSGKFLTGIGGKIAAATIVTVPAFEEAEIALTEEDSVLVASAHGMAVGVPLEVFDGNGSSRTIYTSGTPDILTAAAAPLKPKRSWFEDPGLDRLTPFTIGPEGQVAFHLADWDGCHTGFSNVCVPPFRSPTNYAYFNTGELEMDDGTLVPCGKLMFSRDGGKHASLRMNWQEAAQHYDDSSKVAAYVRAITDRFGTVLAGCLHPDLTDEDIQYLRAHPPSGDWRPIPGKGTELVAAFCVPVPGFPIPRAMVASGAEGELTIITAPLDVELGPAAIRRRREVLKRRRKRMKEGWE